jgi:hypothetical protein
MISIGALYLTWDYSLGTIYLAAGLIVGSSFFVSIYKRVTRGCTNLWATLAENTKISLKVNNFNIKRMYFFLLIL